MIDCQLKKKQIIITMIHNQLPIIIQWKLLLINYQCFDKSIYKEREK